MMELLIFALGVLTGVLGSWYLHERQVIEDLERLQDNAASLQAQVDAVTADVSRVGELLREYDAEHYQGFLDYVKTRGREAGAAKSKEVHEP